MTRYLLAAEADQIQDLLFRSSRLREVAGGSQLLSRFCQEGAPQLLLALGGEARQFIVNDGGAFCVWFTEAAKASEFGRNLAELYRRCTGGSLTVADTLPAYEANDADSFVQASQTAHAALREAKSRGSRYAATAVHLPYAAFCASCGMTAANEHHSRSGADEAPNYICHQCLRKAAAARPSHEQQKRAQGFLDVFRETVEAQLNAAERTDSRVQVTLDYPNCGDWPEALGKLEPRRYVAYLKADGNGMGALFKSCETEDQLHTLSVVLPRVLRESLAAPSADLLARITERLKGWNLLPVLPLILGGDDLFALLPARWALDFAASFCRAYEEKIAAALRDEVGLPDEPQPTIAAAVVICKANYPYSLAHERCAALLKEAKQLARRVELTTNLNVSTLDFAVITGNEVTSSTDERNGDYRNTLRPYFAREPAAAEWERLSKIGLSLTRLIEQRRALCALPGKRRAELEARYDVAVLRGMEKTNEADWARELQLIQRRLLNHDARQVKAAMQALGGIDEATGHWLTLNRPESFKSHGLPDLLAAWDFTWSLTVPQAAYQPTMQEEA